MGGKKATLIAIILLLVLTGGAYGFGVYYFSNHFLPGSSVNGYNCSYMSVEETEALMNREASAFALAVEYQGNGREGVTAREVGLTYSSDGSVKRLIREQNRFTWFLEFAKEHIHDLSRSHSYDETALENAVLGLKCMQTSGSSLPRDAYITADAEGRFVIVPEEPGKTLDAVKVQEVVARAMVTGQVLVDLEQEGCYLRPAVTAEDPQLIRNCETMNRLADVIITLDFGKRTARIDREVIRDWFGYDAQGEVILDTASIRSYVSGLAELYDSVGTERSFRTYDARTITVSGGDFGWVLDVEGETAALKAAVESGETQVLQPVYLRSGYDRQSGNDIGYTYVEVDISHQKLVYYENGVPLIETSCVTGYETPVGVYCAGTADMFRQITGGFMRVYVPELLVPEGGFYVEPDVSSVQMQDGVLISATVSYWMPFAGFAITEGVARSVYGVEGFNHAPTTGNVEIPTPMAAELFGKFTPNLPVVLY